MGNNSDRIPRTPLPTEYDGVPMCDQERCENYDGKRCVILGMRPDAVCKPAVSAMAARITRMEKEHGGMYRRFSDILHAADRLRGVLDIQYHLTDWTPEMMTLALDAMASKFRKSEDERVAANGDVDRMQDERQSLALALTGNADAPHEAVLEAAKAGREAKRNVNAAGVAALVRAARQYRDAVNERDCDFRACGVGDNRKSNVFLNRLANRAMEVDFAFCAGRGVLADEGYAVRSALNLPPDATPDEVMEAAKAGREAVERTAPILAERARQDVKWGVQDHHPAVWALILGEEVGEVAEVVRVAVKRGTGTFNPMIRSALKDLVDAGRNCKTVLEMGPAFRAPDLLRAGPATMDRYLAEMAQCAAVGVAAVECANRAAMEASKEADRG